jgi:putative peptidoglycan lipid II flippase
VAGVVAAPALARLLTAGVDDPVAAEQQRELSTFLLRFFVPQVLLYGIGAVAAAVLHAQRRFSVVAMAPIGNTVLIVAGMAVFAALRDGAAPGLDLSGGEKAVLAAAGTGGVVAFVGVPVAALLMRGFRLVPSFRFRDPLLQATLRHAAWAGFQNASVGILLGSAVIVGMGVPGGVIAYYVAWTFFLVPYAVLGQPIHDVILPELSRDVASGDLEAFGRALRWALNSMTLLVVPAAAAYVGLGRPIMEAVSFGETTAEGTVMMGSALVTMALGLFPYSAFLLLTRASYALGDSRTPTLVSVTAAVAGAVFMFATGPSFGPEGRLAMMGLGVAVAYALAAVALGVRLGRRLEVVLVPAALVRAVPVAALLALGGWALWEAVEPTTRALQFGLLAATGVVGAAVYAGVVHPPSVLRPEARA